MRAFLIVLGVALVSAANAVAAGDSGAAVSPDGTRVAYMHGVSSRRAELVVMTTTGKRVRVLDSLRQPSDILWSPDGRWIAYVKKEIYVVSPDGGKPRRLSGEWTKDGGPAQGLTLMQWRDDRTVEYEVDDCCFLGGVPITYSATVTLSGKQVDRPGEAACWYATNCPATTVRTPLGPRKVETVQGADGATHVHLTGPGVDADLGPGDEPFWGDGHRVLGWRRDGVTVLADPNGADQHELPDDGGLVSAPLWSPDGSRLLVDGVLAGETQLFEAAADGSAAQQLTDLPDGLAAYLDPGSWSAHGRWIVLVKHDGPRVSTTLLTPDGASSRLLVTWKVRYRGQLSGDPTWYSLRWGRSDAFAVYDDDVSCGRTAIFRVDVATTAKTQLTHPC